MTCIDPKVDLVNMNSYIKFGENLSFLYPATFKSAGYYVISSMLKNAFECPSVGPSVCPFVCTPVRPSAHRFHSLLGAFLTNFLQTCYEC